MSNNNGMQVKLLNYGASIEQILVPSMNGDIENIILSLDNIQDYSNSEERVFFGKTVGRVAGRIRDGQWQEGGSVHQLPRNDGYNHMHGGYAGLDTCLFNFKTVSNMTEASVMFSTVDEAGHNGYPGTMNINVKYTLNEQNELRYKIQAITDAPTLFNPTNHVFFSLNGPDTKIDDNMLYINSDYYLPLDTDSLPQGNKESVANTAFDFRKPKLISTALTTNNPEISSEKGLNHPFILKQGSPDVILSAPDKKRRVILKPTAPAIIVYTANRFNHTGIYHNVGRHGGIALEAQQPPVSNHDLSKIELLPGEEFNTQTLWRFEF